RCSIYKLESDKQVISRIYAVDEVEDRKARLAPISMSGSEFEQILDLKKAVYLPDTQKDPHPRRQILAAEGLRSVINVPILSEGDCIGILNALSSEVDAYTEAHIELLGSVADHLALAMKNAELYAQVRETGEWLDNFVRGASDAIITVDLEGRITSWNLGAEAIYGYSEAEILGQSILCIYLEETGEYKEFWDRLSAGKAVSLVETNRRRKDGTAVEVSVTVSPLRDSQGDIVGYSGIHRDIGARKRAEETLRKSERNYRTLFEQASDAIEIIDEKGRIIDCNQKACSMLGYGREELLGRELSEFVSPDHRDTLSQRIARIVDHGLDPYESVNIRKDGTRVPLEVSPGFIEVEGKNHIIFFLRDISERKQAQEMLMRHQKLAALGRLSAGMAHEILNPTNIIGLFAQILSKDAENPDSVREAADAIRLNVGRIAKICDSLRRFSRGGESSMSRFDLGALVQETVSMMEMQIKIEDSSISVELPEDSVLIEADRDQIAQVLLNLLGNARDAMPEGGRIILRLEEFQKEGAPWVGLGVQDEEGGIPKEKLTQIFDPF
ncbi:MAG: PAS domain S-box protein, partial [Nitrospinota bacterium]|nr:PAS domain S-box protein [Nitrospinota bacterium]